MGVVKSLAAGLGCALLLAVLPPAASADPPASTAVPAWFLEATAGSGCVWGSQPPYGPFDDSQILPLGADADEFGLVQANAESGPTCRRTIAPGFEVSCMALYAHARPAFMTDYTFSAACGVSGPGGKNICGREEGFTAFKDGSVEVEPSPQAWIPSDCFHSPAVGSPTGKCKAPRKKKGRKAMIAGCKKKKRTKHKKRARAQSP